MSAISSVNVVAAPGRRGVALSSTNKRSSVRAKPSLSDKFKELKDKLPDVSGVKLPDGLPNFGGDSSSSGGGGDGEGIGYEPKGGGDKLYVGAGKYIEDDKIGILSGTGRDGGQITGGFAGGEVGFQKYRELLAEDEDLTWERARGRAPVYEPVYGGRKGSDEVSLAKDFGGMAGGFPGGEIGVMVGALELFYLFIHFLQCMAVFFLSIPRRHTRTHWRRRTTPINELNVKLKVNDASLFSRP
jgi:hypothetical protein